MRVNLAFIKNRRKELGKTQYAVARESGYRWAKDICLIESGRRLPKADRIPMLAKSLNCEILDLYMEER